MLHASPLLPVARCACQRRRTAHAAAWPGARLLAAWPAGTLSARPQAAGPRRQSLRSLAAAAAFCGTSGPTGARPRCRLPAWQPPPRPALPRPAPCPPTQEDSSPDYLIKAEDCLKDEEERVNSYLHVSTKPKLLKEVRSKAAC